MIRGHDTLGSAFRLVSLDDIARQMGRSAKDKVVGMAQQL
jgi:hypothetical protein